MQTSFIPYANHSIIKGYAMTSSFPSANPGLDTIGEKYENYLSGLVSGGATPNQHAIGKAMANLQSYVSQERAAELAFLAEIGGLVGVNIPNDASGWRILIEAFNKIFSVEAVLNRNVSQLKQLYSKKGKGKAEDITRHLQDYYLPKAIQEFLPITRLSQITDKLTYQIMRRAVELMFSATDKINTDSDQAKEIQCYAEVWRALEGLSHNNPLFKNLASLFNLKDYLKENKDTLNKTKNITKIPPIKATKSSGPGEVLEKIEGAVLSQFGKIGKFSTTSGGITLNTEVLESGDTLQKADTGVLLMDSTASVSIKKEMLGGPTRKDNSYRLRSLERMESILKKIGSKKAQLVFISDKNYWLGNGSFHSKHGGFKAESPTLSSLGAYGAQFHIPNVNGMVEYLASAGPGMIAEDVDMCLEVIKICVGNFLFDDLQISKPANSGVNRVHLLNLGGIYMPASVYLQATLQGLQSVGNFSVDEMVQVEFDPSTTEAGSSTKSNWDSFHKERLKSKINIHFLAGYTNFMNSIFS